MARCIVASIKWYVRLVQMLYVHCAYICTYATRIVTYLTSLFCLRACLLHCEQTVKYHYTTILQYIVLVILQIQVKAAQ